MIDPFTFKMTPITTPARLREAERLLTEAFDILKTFQNEVEAAGDEDETVSDLISALEEPQWLDSSLPDLASDLADSYEDGRAPDELIYCAADFDLPDGEDTEATDETDETEDGDPQDQEGA